MPLAAAVDACLRAAETAGWRVTQEPTGQGAVALLIGTEPWSFSFHNAATLRCEILLVGPAESLLRISASNLGFGPIQNGYVRRRLAETIAALTPRA